MIRLKPTKDIAAQLGKMKREGQKIVAFALETNDEEVNARRKLERKNADFIVLNSTRNSGTTFRSEDNQITIISQTGRRNIQRNRNRRWQRILLTSYLRFSAYDVIIINKVYGKSKEHYSFHILCRVGL